MVRYFRYFAEVSLRTFDGYGFLVFADPHYLAVVIFGAFVCVSHFQLRSRHLQLILCQVARVRKQIICAGCSAGSSSASSASPAVRSELAYVSPQDDALSIRSPITNPRNRATPCYRLNFGSLRPDFPRLGK